MCWQNSVTGPISIPLAQPAGDVLRDVEQALPVGLEGEDRVCPGAWRPYIGNMLAQIDLFAVAAAVPGLLLVEDAIGDWPLEEELAAAVSMPPRWNRSASASGRESG